MKCCRCGDDNATSPLGSLDNLRWFCEACYPEYRNGRLYWPCKPGLLPHEHPEPAPDVCRDALDCLRGPLEIERSES